MKTISLPATTVVTADNNRFCFAASKTAVSCRHWDRPAEDEQTFQLEAKALTLHHDRWLYVGTPVGVTRIDFESDDIWASRKLRVSHKAFDVLATDGEHILAIDDILMPYFATLLLHEDDEPKVLAEWTLPDLVNGTYVDAAIRLDANHTGTVYLLSHETNLGGSNQLVSVHRVEQGKLGPRTFEAAESLGWENNASLLGGTEFTWWNSLAVTSDGTILVPASGRGLASIRPELSRHSLPSEPVFDVEVRDNAIFISIGTEDSPGAIAQLAPTDSGFTIVHSVPMPRGGFRFVH
ncbi:MAG: hypothetical protein KDA60_21365 [Planctomycetales bacterium]|nr:hypothetical protein [Planctomycetales bacterium]